MLAALRVLAVPPVVKIVMLLETNAVARSVMPVLSKTLMSADR